MSPIPNIPPDPSGNSYKDVSDFILNEIMSDAGEVTGYEGMDDMGMNQLVNFEPGAPERIREQLGTEGLPGAVSQMPGPVQPIDEEKYYESVLPIEMFLKFKEFRENLEAQKERNRLSDSINQMNLLLRKQSIEERGDYKQERTRTSRMNDALINLGGYIRTKHPDKMSDKVAMSQDNVMFIAKDIAAQTGDEELVRLYNNVTKYQLEPRPIDVQKLRYTRKAIEKKTKESRIKAQDKYLEEKDFGDLLYRLFSKPFDESVYQDPNFKIMFGNK